MSDWGDTERAAAEIIQVAWQAGYDLTPFCSHAQFSKDQRYIHLWRQGEQIGYKIQGAITELPTRFSESASAFSGAWHETGTLADLTVAFEFIRAWLLEALEVDQLPTEGRDVYRRMIG
jgi:hypothetical protein